MFKNNNLTITIANNTREAQQWLAFGYNIGANNPPGISVNVQESSLMQASSQSSQQLFIVKSIKITAKTANQLYNPISILISDATGASKQEQLIPANYLEPTINIPAMVKIYNPKITINAKVQLSGIINPQETMTIILELQNKSKFSTFLETIFSKNKNWSIKWRLIPQFK